MDSSVFDLAKLQLGAAIASPCRLAQQVMTNPPIAGVAAFAAHQLAKTTLCGHHPFPGRLLEQTPGKVLDVPVITQARAVEQPHGHT